jgi:26S proteasome regulatory subunit N6
MELLKSCNEFFSIIPKAKTAKIVRSVLEIVGTSKDATILDIQIQLCSDVIAWCVMEKRTFLKQRIESKLAILLLVKKSFQESLNLINNLLKELRKLGKILHIQYMYMNYHPSFVCVLVNIHDSV